MSGNDSQLNELQDRIRKILEEKDLLDKQWQQKYNDYEMYT